MCAERCPHAGSFLCPLRLLDQVPLYVVPCRPVALSVGTEAFPVPAVRDCRPLEVCFVWPRRWTLNLVQFELNEVYGGIVARRLH